MKRNRSSNARPNASDELSEDPEVKELDGLAEMGMKADALQMARRAFKNPAISADVFFAALNAVLTHVDRTKPWTKLVDSAYARLPKRGQRAACFLMLAFHSGNHNHEAARQFLPKRFDGPLGLLELDFAMETMLALDRMGEADKLARKFPHAIEAAENPTMKAMLVSSLAEYFAEIGQWEKAVSLLEELRLDSDLAETANLGIVELHLAAAMQAVKKGLESVKKLKSNPDPELAITLPGNEQSRWEKLEKKLNLLGKQLEKMLPKDR